MSRALASQCRVLRRLLHVRHSSTSPRLSPLASAFNSKQIPSLWTNPWNADKDRGLFLIPELTSSEGFKGLKEDCVRRASALVDEAVNPDRTRNVAVIFDDLSDELCRVADMAEFVRLAHPKPEMARAAEESCIAISGLVEQLNTHVGLFGSLKNAVEKGDRFHETEVDKHVAKLFLLDFTQCGIHLDDESRKMVVQLNDYILQIGQQFSAGTHQAKAVKKSALPENIRNHFHIDGDNIVLNGLHIDSPNDLAREAAYKIYYWHNPEQEHLLKELLSHRHHLAQLCEYETFAHRAMMEALGSNPENVRSFLGKLSEDLQPRVQEDYDVMLNMKKHKNPMAKCLEVWDVPYYSLLAKNTWFNLDTSKISEYFSLGVCMEGLNTIFQRLFNVELVMETPEYGELWHADVYKISVRDVADGGAELGIIYCDFFARTGKPFQDCHFTIRGGRRLSDGSYQNPAVVLMLNLTSPGLTTPTLLTASMIDNLFHEMGHAMHSMLARTEYQHVTGTRCSTDFAEVPSTLMEYFASDPRVLSLISGHYRTGEELPLEACEKFCAAKKVFSGVDIQSQLFYSIIDQEFHTQHPINTTTTELLGQAHAQHHNLPYHSGTAWHHRFSHLVGYGARYYSYLMARSVASSIWQKFFQEDPMNSESGRKYREECLAHGGGKPSYQLVSDFLGSDYVKPESLAKALTTEVDMKNASLQDMLKKNQKA